MPIKNLLDRIPGGLMVIPLLLGALLNTLAPGLPAYLGSFTEGLATGAVPILAVWFVCLGASIRLKATGTVLRKSGTLLLTKLGTAWVVAMVFSHVVPGGSITSGALAGLSTLALVSCMDMTNTGLYASLMKQYGSKEEAGAFVLMNVESGPLITLIVLGSAGLANFEPRVLVGLILPFALGYVLGNIDDKMRTFLSSAIEPLIPFFAFALGCGISFEVIAQTGLLGIGTGLAVIVITGIPLIICDVFVGGGNGTAGVGASSTAGAAVATPALVAAAVPSFAPVAPAATALVATSLVVTSLIVPVITALWAKRFAPSVPFLAKRTPDLTSASAPPDDAAQVESARSQNSSTEPVPTPSPVQK